MEPFTILHQRRRSKFCFYDTPKSAGERAIVLLGLCSAVIGPSMIALPNDRLSSYYS